MAAYVIEIGHMGPASVCDHSMKRAPRTVCAPGCSLRHGNDGISRSTPMRSSQCHDGSSSIWSMRWP